MELEKICSRCKSVRSLTDYYYHAGTLDKLQGQCRKCQYELRLRHKLMRDYGLTWDAYTEMMQMQGGCAICGKAREDFKNTGHREKQRLSVDHCHKTGVVRGILCSTCNSAISFLKDDPEMIRKAANYVEKGQMFGGLSEAFAEYII